MCIYKVCVSATLWSRGDETVRKDGTRIIRKLYAETEGPSAVEPYCIPGNLYPLSSMLTAGRIIILTVWLKRLRYEAS